MADLEAVQTAIDKEWQTDCRKEITILFKAPKGC